MNKLDISLFSCNKSESIGSDRHSSEELSVRPKIGRTVRRCAASRGASKKVTSELSEVIVHKPLQRTLSKFRWRSSPDVVIESLKGMSFTISGTLNCLTREDLIEMIETCGGTIYKTLAKKTQYLVIGNNASKTLIRNAIDLRKSVLKEEEFIDLVKAKGKVYKFSNYRQQKEDSDEEESSNGSDILIISDSDSQNN